MKAAFYRGTRPGIPGLYNRVIRWFERGPYSHCELVFSDGASASSSFMDGGVRFKQIEFDPVKWDFIDLPDALEPAARQWFSSHAGLGYDVIGNIRFCLGWIPHDSDKYFCSEAMAASLGFTDSFRYGPNLLFAALQQRNI